MVLTKGAVDLSPRAESPEEGRGDRRPTLSRGEKSQAGADKSAHAALGAVEGTACRRTAQDATKHRGEGVTKRKTSTERKTLT